MPSLLQRVRRGSDTPQAQTQTQTPPASPSHRKRGSVDSSTHSPTKAGFSQNVKSLFSHDSQAGSLKKRLSLSSPSAIFSARPAVEPVSPSKMSSAPPSAPFTPNYSVALPMDTPVEERRASASWTQDENQTRRVSLQLEPQQQQKKQPEVASSWPVMVPDRASMSPTERPSFSHDSGYGSVDRTEAVADKAQAQGQGQGRPSPLSVEIPNSPFAPGFPGVGTMGTPSPRSAVPRPFIRPGLSGRQSSFNVMSSPPMPRPIANLPTLGSPSSVGPQTPGAWGYSASTPSTPGGLGAFNAQLQNKMQAATLSAKPSELNDADVRKARRAMPVMLREPSVRPLPDADDGGEAGDDDDDDDEESESEHEEVLDDSEDEDEHAHVSPTPTPNRKGKGKAKPRIRANTMDAVREEEAGPSSPPGSPKALADRRKLPSPHLGAMPSSPSPKVATASTWAMPTPRSAGPNGKAQTSWTQFQSMTPGATPKQPRGMTPTSFVSQTPSASGDRDRESYFGSSASTSVVQTPSVDPEAHTRDVEVAEDESSAGSSDEMQSQEQEQEPGLEAPAATRAFESPQSQAQPPRPSLYSRPSRSMVDLASPIVETETTKPNKGPGSITMPAAGAISSGMPTPGDWAKPPPTPAVGSGTSPFFVKRKENASPLKRRRSLNDMSKPPPKYVIPDASSGFPQPREDEGREKLPKYWCGVHIEGSLARKMEFSSPGVQSRDRSWKKSYFILHGTSLYVYKHDVHKFPIKRPDGSLVAIPDVGFDESAEYLHVHHPTERKASLIAPPPPVVPAARRGSVADSGQPRRASDASSSTRQSSSPEPASGSRRSSVSVASSSSDIKDAALFNAPPRAPSLPTTSSQAGSSSGGVHLPFHNNVLVKQYTLQNAESGLAADYVKKKNVVRVRAQGEQFLLQTEGAKDVVNWIEAFQAATNVALDLDTRPMPKIITLPRRRRRRRPDGQPLPPGDANPSTTDTPEGNAAAVAAAEAAARASTADRMDSLIVEDQRAGL